MSRKSTVFAAATVLTCIAAAPCTAMSVVPSPLNSDGTPRFTDPGAAPRTFSSGPGQVTTTFGSGSFSFSATESNGMVPGFGNPGFYAPGTTSPYYTGPSNSGFPDQTFPRQVLPNQQVYPGLPFQYVPAPVNRVDPNRPR